VHHDPSLDIGTEYPGLLSFLDNAQQGGMITLGQLREIVDGVPELV
jgi:hypothetical protein